MNDLQRRHFLKLAGSFICTVGLPFSTTALAKTSEQLKFPQGVASGDPETDSVILWTRALHAQHQKVVLRLQVSSSEQFDEVLAEQLLRCDASSDFTVRVLVEGLQPGRHYFYRFLGADGGMSMTGRTMTAPAADDPRTVNLGFASCQNFEQGYFGAWSRMVHEDKQRPVDEQIHFVLHLGDFIYERYGYLDRDGQRYVRKLPDYPDGDGDSELYWADSLSDYRHLYRHYLADPHLQAARARWPFICTWDDHEFSNNGVRDFSTYHEEPKQQTTRKHSANQAWYEYIPARVNQNYQDFKIYRSMRWGSQVDLLLTDLRSYRSLQPLPKGLTRELGLGTTPSELVDIYDGGRAYNNGNPPATLPFGDGKHPNTAVDREPGTMMGAEQKQWFKKQLRSSSAQWRVWGNALPIMALRMDLAELPFMGLENSVLGDDAWSGYPGEYRELMNFAADHGINNFVSLSGDHHSHGAGRLAIDVDAKKPVFVGVDFNVSGISSTPQFNGVLNVGQRDNPEFMQLVAREEDGKLLETWNMTLTQGALSSLTYARTGLGTLADWLAPNKANPGTVYVDSNSNGYGLAQFSAEACEVQLITIEAPVVETGSEGSPIRHVANFRLPSWSKHRQPELEGPSFDGPAPFPFA